MALSIESKAKAFFKKLDLELVGWEADRHEAGNWTATGKSFFEISGDKFLVVAVLFDASVKKYLVTHIALWEGDKHGGLTDYDVSHLPATVARHSIKTHLKQSEVKSSIIRLLSRGSEIDQKAAAFLKHGVSALKEESSDTPISRLRTVWRHPQKFESLLRSLAKELSISELVDIYESMIMKGEYAQILRKSKTKTKVVDAIIRGRRRQINFDTASLQNKEIAIMKVVTAPKSQNFKEESVVFESIFGAFALFSMYALFKIKEEDFASERTKRAVAYLRNSIRASKQISTKDKKEMMKIIEEEAEKSLHGSGVRNRGYGRDRKRTDEIYDGRVIEGDELNETPKGRPKDMDEFQLKSMARKTAKKAARRIAKIFNKYPDFIAGLDKYRLAGDSPEQAARKHARDAKRAAKSRKKETAASGNKPYYVIFAQTTEGDWEQGFGDYNKNTVIQERKDEITRDRGYKNWFIGEFPAPRSGGPSDAITLQVVKDLNSGKLKYSDLKLTGAARVHSFGSAETANAELAFGASTAVSLALLGGMLVGFWKDKKNKRGVEYLKKHIAHSARIGNEKARKMLDIIQAEEDKYEKKVLTDLNLGKTIAKKLLKIYPDLLKDLDPDRLKGNPRDTYKPKKKKKKAETASSVPSPWEDNSSLSEIFDPALANIPAGKQKESEMPFKFSITMSKALVEALESAEYGSFEDAGMDPKKRPLINVIKRSKKGTLKITTFGELADTIYGIRTGLFGDGSWDSYTPAQEAFKKRFQDALKKRLTPDDISVLALLGVKF